MSEGIWRRSSAVSPTSGQRPLPSYERMMSDAGMQEGGVRARVSTVGWGLDGAGRTPPFSSKGSERSGRREPGILTWAQPTNRAFPFRSVVWGTVLCGLSPSLRSTGGQSVKDSPRAFSEQWHPAAFVALTVAGLSRHLTWFPATREATDGGTKKASNLREGESRPLGNGDIAGGSPSHFPKKVRYVRLTGRSSGSRVILLTTPSHSPYGEQWQSVAFVTGHSGGSAPLRLTHASRSDFPMCSAAGAKPPVNRGSQSSLIPHSQD